jgi:hypothetical protein
LTRRSTSECAIRDPTNVSSTQTSGSTSDQIRNVGRSEEASSRALDLGGLADLDDEHALPAREASEQRLGLDRADARDLLRACGRMTRAPCAPSLRVTCRPSDLRFLTRSGAESAPSERASRPITRLLLHVGRMQATIRHAPDIDGTRPPTPWFNVPPLGCVRPRTTATASRRSGRASEA